MIVMMSAMIHILSLLFGAGDQAATRISFNSFLFSSSRLPPETLELHCPFIVAV
jgi:hypothetical protein